MKILNVVKYLRQLVLVTSLTALADGVYYIKAGTFDLAGNNKTINSSNFTIGN